MKINDTICAIATAMTNSGIGIVRISGSEAIEKVNKIYQGKVPLTQVASHTVHYGHIVYKEEIIDEVMVLVMKGPRSYTTEDTVEIDCHGGMLVMQRILEAVAAQGVRIAEPGEFTKRAFLHGRIDLSQAESVMDLISSESDVALQNSLHQLQGTFSKKIRSMREEILYQIAYIESALDDPEHISLDGFSEELVTKVSSLLGEIDRLLATSRDGALIKEGIRTTIIGKPNAGKSSLLNLLAKKDRAIVTDIAGTTRDTLEEKVMIGGVTLQMIDTAGIRDTEDLVEKIGVQKAMDTLEDADLILYVVDSSVPLDDNDHQILSSIQGRNAIILFNKSDLPSVLSEEDFIFYGIHPVLSFSTKNGDGTEQLTSMIQKMFFSGEIKESREFFLTNARHIEALQNAKESLLHVKESLSLSMPEDFLSIDLMDAYESLGKILGESVEEDLVNEIFSKFCTGK